METAAQPHLRGESWTAAQPQLRGESSTAGRPQLASAAAEHADDWFTAPRSRVAALLAFFVLSEAAGILRSGARAYFYRTGAVCICPQLLAPGEEGWSGSRYCGDADAVILHATRLSSDLLLLQLGLDVLVTPLFAALADKWSCVGVIAFHIAAGCLALAGYAATAAHVPAAAEAWLTEREGEGDWDLASPLPLNGTNCTADAQSVLPTELLLPSTVLAGFAGATLTAPSTALVLRMAAARRRGLAALVMLALRGVGALLGSVATLGLITCALEDYAAAFVALACVQAAVALPLAHVGDGGDGGGGEPSSPPSLLGCCSSARRHARRACAALLPAVRDLARLLARSRWLPQVLVSTSCSAFGVVGAASLLPSFVQTQFKWTQGTLELYVLGAGLPTSVVGAYLTLAVVRPRLGPAGVLCYGQLLMLLGAALLCVLPFEEAAVPVLVLYVVCAVLGALPTPSLLAMLAHRYPLHEQARVQGLLGALTAAGAAAGLQVYAKALYDPRARGVDAALPFLVSLGAETVACVLFISAMWAELPDWATLTRRDVELIVDEDMFQLEWAKRAARPQQTTLHPAWDDDGSTHL